MLTFMYRVHFVTTMADVAREVQVSVQTVSAVVNGKPGISGATEARVREALVRLDYHPNAQARALRGVPARTIGVIIPSITNPYFPEFVKGVEQAARSEGYSIFLCNADAELAHLLEYFALIRTNRASGLICSFGLASHWLTDPEVSRWLRKFAKSGVPVVLNGSAATDLPILSVRVDTPLAIGQAAKHLVDLGHRSIAIISPPVGLPVTRERVGAFRAAFGQLGVPLRDDFVVPGDFEIDAGIEATRELFRRGRPTAIVAANDLAAIGAISALTEMGRRVPDDVSVLGFDDIPFARVVQPALTTIRQPVYELGRAALHLAIDSPERTAADPHVLEASFVARRSTGPVPAD
jgi:LacI family transcriptional regulator